jgi:VanZ family protein
MKYATLIVSLLITIAVLIPGSNLPDVGVGGLDKIVHMGMFAVWAVAVRYDLNTKAFKFLPVFALGILFSLLTEVIQLLVEGRTFDVYDMAADAIGIVIGLLVGGQVVKLIDKVK